MLSFLRANFRWIAGGFLLAFFSSYGQTFFIAGSVAEWQEKFDLSHGEFGRLFMLATLASAIVLPFIGRIVDVIPEHRAILLVMPGLAVATIIVTIAPSVLVLTFGLFLLRLLGQGMMSHIALTAVGRWFAAQRGRAVSLVSLGFQVGAGTLPLFFSLIAAATGWQWGWVAAGVSLIVALPLAVWAFRKPRLPQGTVHAAETTVRDWTRGEVLRDGIFWLLLTGVLAPPFIYTTIYFHQDYLVALRDWPPAIFPLGLTLVAVTTATTSLLFGAVVDRFSAKAVLPLFLVPLAIGCFTMALIDAPYGVFVSMFFLGISHGISVTLFGSLWPEIYGVRSLGAIRSVIVSFQVLATAIGPGITGSLIDLGIDFPTQMIGFGGLLRAHRGGDGVRFIGPATTSTPQRSRRRYDAGRE